MLTKEVLDTIFWQITLPELFIGNNDKLLKIDIWQIFYALLLTETDEEYNLKELSEETVHMMISSIENFERENGLNTIIQQLFCVITSKSCEE
jgi:hypothetical protein